jgi:hypothetical protein
MGRTLPTYRMLLQQLEVQWGPYRRALRVEDREAFDAVMELARMHASASSFMVDSDPMDALFMSVLVEQQKEILALRRGGSPPKDQ